MLKIKLSSKKAYKCALSILFGSYVELWKDHVYMKLQSVCIKIPFLSQNFRQILNGSNIDNSTTVLKLLVKY